MPTIRIDFTRMDLGYELAAMSRLRESLEDHLRIAAEVEAPAVVAGYLSEWDDQEAAHAMAADEITDLRDVVFPRLMRGSFVVVLYAVFENCVERFVDEARTITKTDRGFKRPHNSLLANCRDFFRDHLGYPLWDDETFEFLSLLADVRHVFAHRAGRLDSARLARYKALEGSPDAPGRVAHEYLVPNPGFIVGASATVERALRELAEQLQPGVKAVTTVDDGDVDS